MNKKVSKQFKDIKDIYLLQCICTEQSDEIERLHSIIKEVLEYLDISNMSFVDKNEIAIRLKGSEKE